MLKSLQTDRHSDERRTTGDQKKFNNQPQKYRLKNLTKRENKTKLKKRGK